MKLSSTLAASLAISSATAFAPLQTGTTHSSLTLLSSVDDKTEVREYFNTEGFSRWNKIYSESDDVNSVQLDIRTGHDQTIDKILKWIEADGDIVGKSVCDCGCGVGSLAIPLAQMGKSLIFIFISKRYFLWNRKMTKLKTSTEGPISHVFKCYSVLVSEKLKKCRRKGIGQ